MTWHIEDWASSDEKFNGIRFDSFEEARDFIQEQANEEAAREYPDNEELREQLSEGICEDLYAIEDQA